MLSVTAAQAIGYAMSIGNRIGAATFGPADEFGALECD